MSVEVMQGQSRTKDSTKRMTIKIAIILEFSSISWLPFSQKTLKSWKMFHMVHLSKKGSKNSLQSPSMLYFCQFWNISKSLIYFIWKFNFALCCHFWSKCIQFLSWYQRDGSWTGSFCLFVRPWYRLAR